MRAIDHPNYQEELQRLKTTLQYVEESIKESESRLAILAKDAQGTKKRYRQENSQDFIEKLVASRMYDNLQLKIQNLESSLKKPYFARIDFQEAGKSDKQQLYLGKVSLLREDLTPEIVDWRAPIANLYYEGHLGNTSYTCPDGEIAGELFLKRQYSIDEAQLNEIFDIDITSNDQFLQDYLSANTDKRLKDIVATIQVEQNRIVRAPMEKSLIIQGAAGSGKTTVALHRVAYLIYNHQNFQPDSFMIIAPNRLFLNYISGVLPELGVEYVKQTTFVDMVKELVNEKYKLIDGYERLVTLVEENPIQQKKTFKLANEYLKKLSKFKTSLAFKDALDEYIKYIEEILLPRGDFVAGGQILYTDSQIQEMYLRDYQHWPFYQRIEQISKHFKKKLKDWKESRVANIHAICEKKIFKLKMTMAETEERRLMICRIYDEKDQNLAQTEEIYKDAVNQYLEKIPQIGAVEYYQNLFMDDVLFNRFVGKRLDSQSHFIKEETIKSLKLNAIEVEDLAPLLLIKHRCYGWNHKIKTRHIVIDEAQDFSLFQYAVLKEIFDESTFTILGDLHQGIFSFRGLEDWRDLQEQVLPESELMVLEQSYRTTIEIMEASSRVLTGFEQFNRFQTKPGIRHGQPVRIILKESNTEVLKDIAEKIKSLTEEYHYQSMAVICKTSANIPKILKVLKEGDVKAAQITEKDADYKGGVLVLPSYLAKGLEFDVVFIADADGWNYRLDELDVKLLYVAMTRPLHQLFIYYTGQLSPMLVS